MTSEHIPTAVEDQPELHAHIVSGTATQPQRFVIGEGKTRDELQASGAWLGSDTVVEVRQ